MPQTQLGRNIEFAIMNANGSPFHDLVMKKATYDSVVMSLGDSITGDVYYKDNTLTFTMQEYIEWKNNPDDANETPIKFVLVNPPTIVREGMVSDNSELKGMTKYSLTFYHPMYKLSSIAMSDIAVTQDERKYKSQDKTFSWIGNLFEFRDKLNAMLTTTEWQVYVDIPQYEEDGVTLTQQWQKAMELCEVTSFDKQYISDGLKFAYDTWEIPFTITPLTNVQGKTFAITFGTPSQEIYDTDGTTPYVFQMGQGVGLKNNSRTPKNNKIVTRIFGYGSDRNVPYGYPQIVWTGNQSWNYTINNDASEPNSYPIYDGIVGGQYVKLIKHPFTRTTLMPSVYVESVNKKVNPLASNYNPNQEIIDYYDATQEEHYPNPINLLAPSCESHQFEDEYPRLGEDKTIVSVLPYDDTTYMAYIDYASLVDSLAQQTSNKWESYYLRLSADIIPTLTQDTYYESVGGSTTEKISLKYHSYGGGKWFEVTMVSPDFNFTYNVYYGSASPATMVDWDDSMNDDGDYTQKYFKLTLPQLGSYNQQTQEWEGIDVYACAAITEEMNINMRSGNCMGCTFTVQVDWEDYKRNFYKEDGTFDPVIHETAGDGHVRDGSKYPDSRKGQITVIVQKDLETFGTLMPNIYQQPASGDKFVILGISLPTSYITNAQLKLDDTIKEYMMENNVYYFEYPIKFDEHFLATRTDILLQIRNNSILRFLYAGTNMVLYIKQITIKYGQAPLPQYDITLTDDVEIVLNQLGQVTDDVSRMRVQVSELQKYYSENLIQEINNRLSRVVDDVCQGRITFQQGLDALGRVILSDEIASNGFTSGLYGGKGWRIDQLGNGEMESLRVRSYLEVVELLINRLQAQEGDTLFTDNDQIEKVDTKYVAVTPQSGDNPKASNWYEIVNDKYVMTTDTSVVALKTYYVAYYTLSLKEKWEGYFTSQKVGNILKGIVNTLAASEGQVSKVTTEQSVETDGVNKFYTSWMLVVDKSEAGISSLDSNQIVVRLWRDNEGGNYDVSPQDTKGVPAGRNFEPCELMSIARWGCLDPDQIYTNPTQSQIDEVRSRQNSFYISAKEGRIAKLTRVCQPILYNWNYGTTLGILPEFVRTEWTSIASRLIDGRDYLYAQGVVVQDFIKVDYQGAPLINYVDCGDWQNNKRYYHNEYNSTSMQWETSDVWHNGSYWRCKVSQPVIIGGISHYYEPTDANSQYWEKLLTSGEDGDDGVTYSIECTPEQATIASDATSGTIDIDAYFYKTVGGTRSEYFAYCALFSRSTSGTYTRLSRTTTTVNAFCAIGRAIDNTLEALILYFGDSEFAPTKPTNYLCKFEIPILKNGDTGGQGQRGKVGRFFYYGGVFNSSNTSQTFIVNDAQAPYFKDSANANSYHVFDYDTNGSYTMAQMWSLSNQSFNNAPWVVMTNDFAYIITQAIFGSYAQFGSAIINGDWMLSTHGTIYDSSDNAHKINDIYTWNDGGVIYNKNNAYTLFDTSYPNSSKPNANNFVPNYCVDLKTGATYQQNAYINGELNFKSMAMQFDDVRVSGGHVIAVVDGRSTGIWNYIAGSTDGMFDVLILPTDRYSLIGQRVTVYCNIPSSGSGAKVALLTGTYTNGTFYEDKFRGVGIPQSSGDTSPLTPIEMNAYYTVEEIDFSDGIVELICVPPTNVGQICEWCVVNIGTNICELHRFYDDNILS